MIDAILRAFRPIGKKRHDESDQLIHDLHNATQAVEAERYLIQQDRIKSAQRHWLERALTPQQILDREREQLCDAD